MRNKVVKQVFFMKSFFERGRCNVSLQYVETKYIFTSSQRGETFFNGPGRIYVKVIKRSFIVFYPQTCNQNAIFW